MTIGGRQIIVNGKTQLGISAATLCILCGGIWSAATWKSSVEAHFQSVETKLEAVVDHQRGETDELVTLKRDFMKVQAEGSPITQQHFKDQEKRIDNLEARPLR